MTEGLYEIENQSVLRLTPYSSLIGQNRLNAQSALFGTQIPRGVQTITRVLIGYSYTNRTLPSPDQNCIGLTVRALLLPPLVFRPNGNISLASSVGSGPRFVASHLSRGA